MSAISIFFIRYKANHSIGMHRLNPDASTFDVVYAIIVCCFITIVLLPKACKYMYALYCNHNKQ